MTAVQCAKPPRCHRGHPAAGPRTFRARVGRAGGSVAVIGLCLSLCAGAAQVAASLKCEIKGRVSEADSGVGIEGAEVTVSASSGKISSQTDKNGRFLLGDLTAGDYSVFVQKTGFGGQISRIRNVHVDPGGTAAAIDFKLPRESIVSGRVIDPKKNPVAHVRVHISKVVYRNGRFTLTNRGESRTDDLGLYRFARLDEGKYVIDVDAERPEVQLLSAKSAAGRTPVTNLVHTFYPNATWAGGAATIQLGTGEEQREVNILMAAEITHCITATLNSADAAVAALWFPVPGGYRTIGGGLVDRGAKFRICGLGEGPYKLTLGTHDEHGGAMTMTSSLFAMGREDVDLGALTPSAGSQVAGRVFVDGATENSVPSGITVALYPTNELRFINEVLEAGVSDSGTFEIPNVLGSGEEYWVFVYHLPAGYYVKSARIGSHDARREPVAPGEGQSASVSQKTARS